MVQLLLAVLLSTMVMLSGSDQKTNAVSVSVVEEILLTQSGSNANLKIRLSSGVTAQIWGDSSTGCSSATGSLNETTSGTYTIPLNTIPFGSNQNNYVCVHSSDSHLNANVVWPHTAASVAFVQQPSTTVAGSTITPAVTVGVYDTTGTLISSSAASITLAIGTNPGGGTLSGTLTRSAVNGIATFNDLSINKDGAGYTLAASSTGLTGAASSTFNITSGAVSASTSTVSASPTSVTADGTTTSTITVTLKDANSNPVSGKTVTLSQASGHSTISAASGLSNSSGVVTFTVKDTVAEPVTYTATDTTDSVTITQTASVTFTPGTLASFALSLASPQTDGVAFTGTNTLTAKDANNNTITTFNAATNNVTITANPPLTGTVSGIHGGNVLNQSGDFTSGMANLTSLGITYTGNATSGTFTATSGGKTGTASVTISVGSATQLAFTTSPSNSTAGTAFGTQPVVKVQDTGGNTVTSSSASITLAIGTNPGGGTLTCTTNPLNATSGVATFGGCKIDKGSNSNYTLTASSSGLITATSTGFLVGDFAVSAPNPSPNPVIKGNSSTATVSLTNLGGFSGNVALTCTSVTPATGSHPLVCSAVSFSPTSISGAVNSTMTVAVPGNTTANTYSITITGTSGTLTRSVNVSLQTQ